MNNTEIWTLQDLDNVRDNPTLDYILMRDLDFDDDDSYDQTDSNWEIKKISWTTGNGWPPLSGRHDYNFDGNNHVIINLYINRNSHFQGLFGDVRDCEIKNVGIIDANISSTQTYNGILVGLIRGGGGIVENCYSTGIINSGSHAGGLIGSHWGNYIQLSWSSADVNGGSSSGGLIGTNNGSDVYDCFASGDVTSSGTTGGLIGTSSNSCTIYRCFSTGNVHGGNYTGGLIGMKRTGIAVVNCYSHSKTTGAAVVGGLIGDCGVDVDKCYSTGEITANNHDGGLIGFDRGGNTSNSYWDTEASGYTTSAGGIGKNTAQMQNIETYLPVWDIVINENHDGVMETAVWFISDNSYPKLWFEFEPNIDPGKSNLIIKGTVGKVTIGGTATNVLKLT